MNEKEKSILTDWQKLPFTGFTAEKKKKELWYNYGLEVFNSLSAGFNTGLIGETGSGKTIMTLLALESLKLRAVFFAPTVILVHQHAKLYKKITGKDAVVVTGKKKKRSWKEGDLVIATPHVFMVDYEKGEVSENDFNLFVFDEMHKGSGLYPYVPISKLVQKVNKPILALSASPAGSLEGISYMERTYNIKQWVTADIEMPNKKTRLEKVEPSQEMLDSAEYLKEYYLNILRTLSEVFFKLNKPKIIALSKDDPFLKQEDNEKINRMIAEIKKPEFYTASRLFAKLLKISHLYRLLMTEGYAAYLDYYKNRLGADKSKSGKELFANKELRNIYWRIKRTSDPHPKEEGMTKLVKEMSYKRKSMLVFVNSKKTGAHLANYFSKLGYPAGTLFGGADKSVKNNEKTIQDLVDGTIEIVFATSVVEEGLSLPEIGAVVHYNLPMTEIARLQRSGRTGRFTEGIVVFLITNIPYEISLYFATLANLRKMKNIFYESEREKTRILKANKKNKKMKVTSQLEIKFQEFEARLPF